MPDDNEIPRRSKAKIKNCTFKNNGVAIGSNGKLEFDLHNNTFENNGKDFEYIDPGSQSENHVRQASAFTGYTLRPHNQLKKDE